MCFFSAYRMADSLHLFHSHVAKTSSQTSGLPRSHLPRKVEPRQRPLPQRVLRELHEVRLGSAVLLKVFGHDLESPSKGAGEVGEGAVGEDGVVAGGDEGEVETDSVGGVDAAVAAKVQIALLEGGRLCLWSYGGENQFTALRLCSSAGAFPFPIPCHR